MKTKTRNPRVTTSVTWTTSIPAISCFTLVINQLLLLAFSLSAIAQDSQRGKIVSAGNNENQVTISNSLLPVRTITDQEVARKWDLTLDQVRYLHMSMGLSNQEIAAMPQSKLEAVLWQVRHPTVDPHAEALKFRRLMLQDEKGQIPTNAWMRAAAQRQLMTSSPKGVPTSPGLNSPVPKQAGLMKPKVAGIESSGWSWLGPGNIGGRVLCILVHPTTPSIMWAGSAGGGVWKTLNGGASWFPLDDFMSSLAIGCMAMDPANPNVIYAGTGEGYGNYDAIQGAGIFKTTDGGTTWAQLPSTATSAFYYVNRLAISPANSQIMLAATGTGIYRSIDGGTNWSLRYSAGTTDLAFDPLDGSQCIASGFGFVRFSNDGGLTWVSATGIPGTGRIEIAYAPNTPAAVYASADNNYGEVYRSLDGGQTYSLRNTGTNYFLEPGSEQGWYDNCIWVDPTNPNIIVVGGLDLWRSTDGGATLTDIGGYSGGPHPDQHAIVGTSLFNGTTVRTVYFGNDGGVFSAADIYTVSPGSGWTDLNNNLGVTEFSGAAGNATSGTIVGGTQDNGTIRYTPGTGIEGWTGTAGGDGGVAAADPTDPNYFYGERPYLAIFRSTDGGGSSTGIWPGIADANSPSLNFISPFVLDPNNPNIILAGGLSLWRSTNVKAATPTWSVIKAPTGQAISAVAVAPGNSSIIWVGYNDGSVYATANGTASSPTWVQKNFGTPNLPNRFCSRLTIDPNNQNEVYATFGGFSSGNVWRTTDGGTTWTDLSANLPQAPVFSLVVSPHESSFLYVGTEVGIFASENGGVSWSPSNDGPANVEVVDLSWVGDTLLAATHGRGCFAIQPIVWVDFNYTLLPQTGTYATPFHTLAQGVGAVSSGGDIFIKTAGSSPETIAISKAMNIRAYNGTATIGH